MQDNNYYVYILTNKAHTVLYTGVTSNLSKRLFEHQNDLSPDGFTARYRVHQLVYFETTTDIRSAIEREKQIKAGSRKKKINLIQGFNPDWKDLSEQVFG